jgi:hypothetical protein
MTDMQTHLLFLIARPFILNLAMHFSTQLLTGEMKCPTGYTFAFRISFHLLHWWSINLHQGTCNKHICKWYYSLSHSMSSRGLIGSLVATPLALYGCSRSIGTKSLLKLHHTSHPSLQLSLHNSNPVLVSQAMSLDHLYLATWKKLATSPPWLKLLTLVYLWTNHLCIST